MEQNARAMRTEGTKRALIPNPPIPASAYSPYRDMDESTRNWLDRMLDATSFQLVLVREWSGPPGWRLGGRREPTVFFFWLESGTAACRIGADPQTLTVKAGDIVLAPERVFVDMWSVGNDPVPHACGRLSARVYGGCDLCAILDLCGVFPGGARTAALIKELAREFLLKPPGWRKSCDAAVAALVLRLVRDHAQPEEHLKEPPLAALRRLDPALAVVNARFADPGLRVAELGRAVALSQAGFRQLCRQAVGRSPRELIHRRRIEAACHWLIASDLPIKTVAERSGFNDTAFFCRCFRQSTGLTPTAYRTAR